MDAGGRATQGAVAEGKSVRPSAAGSWVGAKKNLRTRGVKPEVQKALIRIKAPLREEDERITYFGHRDAA